MIGSTRTLWVFAYAGPVGDLRKGFDGLYGPVAGKLGRDPLSGDCFLFVNRARERITRGPIPGDGGLERT
jgi:hypothetical protein